MDDRAMDDRALDKVEAHLDPLLNENVLVGHCRRPYTGKWRVLAAMSG